MFGSYIIKRILVTIPVLFGVVTVTFILMFIIPADPIQGMVGERATEETIQSIRQELGLDKPFIIQYSRYLGRLLRGDLGRSYWTRQDVLTTLLKRFPNTLRLALASMIIAILIGMWLGILPTLIRNPSISFLVDRLTMILATLFISTPVFWLGLLLIFFFSIKLRLLPACGMGGGEIKYLILPAITLATRSAAFIARITRTAMLEAISKEYIRTARAKGLPEWVVILKHALRSALIPIVTLIGLDVASLLNGSILTETIFGWPGIGRYAWEGIQRRDMNVVMGSVLFGATVFVIINLVVDIVYHFIDPRVRLVERRVFL